MFVATFFSRDQFLSIIIMQHFEFISIHLIFKITIIVVYYIYFIYYIERMVNNSILLYICLHLFIKYLDLYIFNC